MPSDQTSVTVPKAVARRNTPEARRTKAHKILAVLRDYLGPSNGLTALDIGCAHGIIGEELAGQFKRYVGCDIDRDLVVQAASPRKSSLVGDGERLPLANGSVDVVICAQVYEHTQRPDRLFNEIGRVLRAGGVCFFSGPNKLQVIEEHYWLPGLHWLPTRLADRYLKASGRGKRFDIRIADYWNLRRLVGDFDVIDYLPALLQVPEAFEMRLPDPILWVTRRIPASFVRRLGPFTPNFNWLLVKTAGEKHSQPILILKDEVR